MVSGLLSMLRFSDKKKIAGDAISFIADNAGKCEFAIEYVVKNHGDPLKKALGKLKKTTRDQLVYLLTDSK
jgi:hypothetical protein